MLRNQSGFEKLQEKRVFSNFPRSDGSLWLWGIWPSYLVETFHRGPSTYPSTQTNSKHAKSQDPTKRSRGEKSGEKPNQTKTQTRSWHKNFRGRDFFIAKINNVWSYCWRSLLTKFDRQIRHKKEETNISNTHMLLTLTLFHMYWRIVVLQDTCKKCMGIESKCAK
jgi:hypothetical protein